MQMTAPAARAIRSPKARRLWLGLLFVSPWIIGYCVFYLYPFLATIYYSFTSFTGIGNPTFTGLSNYSALLHDAMFRTAVWNTVYYTAIEVPFSTVAATEAIASGDAVSRPSPQVSWASSAPEALAGTFMYDPVMLPPRPMSHFWSRP